MPVVDPQGVDPQAADRFLETAGSKSTARWQGSIPAFMTLSVCHSILFQDACRDQGVHLDQIGFDKADARNRKERARAIVERWIKELCGLR